MGLCFKPAEWAVQHQPAANTQATISKAADAGGRHIATGLTVALAGTSASGLVTVNLRDGATGAGDILWSATMIVLAGDSKSVSLGGMSIEGTKNTAMTLEFDAAGGAATEETVSLVGYTCKENYVGV
jgi:hypothetical protein